VARHLTLGHPPRALIATLGRALLREDAGFHAYQMLEAGARQFGEWGNTGEGRHILIAVARYLAAHSPTERAGLQTADIARRLMRGEELHQEEGVTSQGESKRPQLAVFLHDKHPRTSDPLGNPREMTEPDSLGG
jgi:hypothetical protein